MSHELKPRVDFDQPLGDKTSLKLKPSQHFDIQQSFQAIEADSLQEEQDEGQAEGVVISALHPKRSFWRRMAGVGVALFGVSVIAQSVHWFYQAWIEQNWITLGGVCAGMLIVTAGVGSLITEWRRLYCLRQRTEERDEARELLHSHGIGQAKEFCKKLMSQAGLDASHPAVQRWQAALHDSHSDREVVTLYAKLVQPVLDSQARKEIGRCAAESTLMIAVSPLAIVDMAFIAWRNLRLVNRIARVYGIELGYFSRIRLFRLVLLNIAFAGASELIREVGMDWLSQDLAARLSIRAAQGIGAGLLTARLGIKAMELCRPLPWLADDKPKLGEFRKDLINQLKQRIPLNKNNANKS